jgi:hypothetical protein
MKVKHIRCGICHDWHHFNVACHACGAVQVRLGKGRIIYINRNTLREMVRGFATPLHEMIRQDWSWMTEDRENIQNVGQR